jgi:hypothetical protein
LSGALRRLFEQQRENEVGSGFDTRGACPIASARIATRFDIDWRAVEVDYVAAKLSPCEMAKRHGCSHSAIANRAARHGWVRCHVATEDVVALESTMPRQWAWIR